MEKAPKAGRFGAFARTRRGRIGLILCPLLVLVIVAIALGVTFGVRAHQDHASELSSITITLVSSAPSNASALDSALMGFSIEGDRWTDWAGINETNQLFANALGNLRNKTGAAPWIRIGADSEDRTKFNASTNYSHGIFAPPSSLRPYPEATNLTVGNGYYSLVSHLPSDTPVVFGVNMAFNNTQNALLMGRSIMTAFADSATKGKNISLAFLEIGNEGDIYSSTDHNLRAPKYTAQDWVNEWTSLATNLTAELQLANHGTRIWGPSFSFSTHGAGFSPQGVMQLGLRSSTAGKLLQAVSQHHYSGTFCFGSRAVLQDLMLKANVQGNVSAFLPDIAAAHAAGMDYVFGETNSISCHGAPGVSDAGAAALWHIQYTLTAASMGVRRLFFHEGVGYKYALIQPVPLKTDIEHGTLLQSPLPPHVQPQYYGALFVADAIGTSGDARVVSVDVKHPYASVYAIYEGLALKRAVIVNGLAWTSTNAAEKGANRPSMHVTIAGLTGSSTLTVRRLVIPAADQTYPAAALTWAGQSYNTTDALASGSVVIETVELSAGVDVAASEAILIDFS